MGALTQFAQQPVVAAVLRDPCETIGGGGGASRRKPPGRIDKAADAYDRYLVILASEDWLWRLTEDTSWM